MVCRSSSQFQLSNYLPMIVTRGDDIDLWISIVASRSCRDGGSGSSANFSPASLLTQIRNRVVTSRVVQRVSVTSTLGNFENELCVRRHTISCSVKRVIGQSPPESLSSIDSTCAVVYIIDVRRDASTPAT
ncbi:unnamed protein product [Lasius platythorax]|uniref:Uncharacterized protein n=1 Tax=Lasius platythorax TaxID=488582 RepID=A0AAV2N5F4_9HYME